MKEDNKMPRYYLGVDWGDRVHQLYGGNENGTKVMEMKLQESPEGLNGVGALARSEQS